MTANQAVVEDQNDYGEKREKKYFSFLFFRATNVTLPTTQR
jgi:hypothetical protein